MNKKVEWPVDFIIKPTVKKSLVDDNISLLRLKTLNEGICPVGNIRLGLIEILNQDELAINLDELDSRFTEKDIVGSSIWRDFSLNTEKIPLAWLNFRLNFSSIFVGGTSRFIISFYANSNGKIMGFARGVTNPFTPRRNDRFVCFIKENNDES